MLRYYTQLLEEEKSIREYLNALQSEKDRNFIPHRKCDKSTAHQSLSTASNKIHSNDPKVIEQHIMEIP